MITQTELLIPHIKQIKKKPDSQAFLRAETARLIHAAVINKHFREDLLANPDHCIRAGYCGEYFHFPHDFQCRLEQIHALNLEDFAAQVLQLLSSKQITEMAALPSR